MKQFILCIVVILLCVTSSMSQSQRKNSKKRTANDIPVELAEQIINEHGARDWVNDHYNGSSVKFSQSWEIKRVDLNKDKTPEFIIHALDTYFCGSQWCSLLIYQKTANGYRSLSEDKLDIRSAGRVFTGRTYTNGYLDLYVKVNGKTESKFIFNGRYYQYKE